MQKRAFALIFICLLLAGCAPRTDDTPHRRTVFAMDTVMNLTVYGKNSEKALDAAEQGLYRLDALLARGVEDSAVYRLNTLGAVNDATLAYLLGECESVWERTDGAFDPTIADVLDLWGFGSGAGEHRVPTADELAAAKEGVGLWGLHIEGAQVANEGRSIDLGGVAKGYAGYRVCELLRENGVESAVIDLGGDVALLGKKPDGSLWRVAVKDPSDESAFLGLLETADSFVVTSGVYERYFEENGTRYHHIIDPKTGYPADSDLISATVLIENTRAWGGVRADALATAACVTGSVQALSLRDTLYQESNGEMAYDLILVTKDGRVLYTDGALNGGFTPETNNGYAYEQVA